MNPEYYRLSREVQITLERGQVRFRISDGEAVVTAEDARTLKAFGEPTSIEEFLSGVCRNPEELARWRDLLDHFFVLRLLVPAGVPKGEKPALLSRTNKDCSQLFLVFTGSGGGMGMRNGADSVSFVREAGLIDRNFILFRDFSRSRYLHGISTEVPSFRSLLEWIREFKLNHSQISSLYTVGNSMGCGAAIIAGHHLKANQVFGFSPGWVRFPEGIREAPDEGWDLPGLLRNYNGCTQYHVYFASGVPRDCQIAKSLAGLPGVALHPVETARHNSLPALIETGQLTMFPAMETIQ